MGKVLRVLLVLALVLAAVGYFRCWFSLSRIDEETTTRIILTVDRQRIREDLRLARQRVDEIQEKIGREEVPAAASEPPAGAAESRAASPPPGEAEEPPRR